MLTEEEKKILGIKESYPPQSPPKEKEFKTAAVSKSIEEKRGELEILRIDKEIERLNKPDISEGNYFKDMLAQQQQHFNQLIEMNRQHNDLRLEIEKLKLMSMQEGGDDTLTYLEYLKPFIPVIAEQMKKKQQKAAKETKGGEEMQNAAQILEYKEKIKKGEITKEQAYQDFLEMKKKLPEEISKTLTDETFNKEFEKIKNENL